MSESQLAALLAKIKTDATLRLRLMSASDLPSAVELARAAGFDVTDSDWLNYQASQGLITELSDNELEGVAGGAGQTEKQSCEKDYVFKCE